MNFTPLMENSYSFEPLENDEAKQLIVPFIDGVVDEFYKDSISQLGMKESNESILNIFDYQEEAFDMQKMLNGTDLVGGVSPNPTYPNVVSMDFSEPLGLLRMYTSTLLHLAAPAELCVLKALELISSRANYELQLEAFHMELLKEHLAEAGEVEIHALLKGIACIASYLLNYFDNLTQSKRDFFPYEYNTLHMGRYLFLSKVVFDADLPTYSRTTIAKPAYTYPEVQAKARATYSSQANHVEHI